MRPLTDGSRFARRALLGDLVAIVCFLAVGLERHAENVAGRFASLVAIFVASWVATAWSVGTYRPPTSGRLALTLVLSIPLAVAVRAAIVRAWTTGEVWTFMVVAVAFCGAFVALVRLALVFAERRST